MHMGDGVKRDTREVPQQSPRDRCAPSSMAMSANLSTPGRVGANARRTERRPRVSPAAAAAAACRGWPHPLRAAPAAAARVSGAAPEPTLEGRDAPAPALAPPPARDWRQLLSFDEEAEDGCGADGAACAVEPLEASRLAAAAAALTAGARARAPVAACSAFLHPSALPLPQRALAGAAAVGSAAYFASKPLTMSYDEEAEGCYEAAAAEAAAARAARAATFSVRRAEARAARAARRGALRAASAPGALEAMPPWLEPGAAAAADADAAVRAAAAAVGRAALHGRAPAARYPHLASFLAATTGCIDLLDGALESLTRERGLQARHVAAWQRTWDEDVHGGGALNSM
ncbi:MAG: hypothetical protein J3K34DRAFT_462063 [Monoraphidium minutum]|nr:MAG: hypothetical protein J3K34DRAFT_462063 [Monoraphidium minutum]